LLKLYTGILSSAGGLQAQAFIPSTYAKRKDWGDIQLYISSVGSFTFAEYDLARVLNYEPALAKSILQHVTGDLDSFTQLITLVKPKSTGYIQLKDKNPFSQPLINPKYLDHPQDVKVLIEGNNYQQWHP